MADLKPGRRNFDLTGNAVVNDYTFKCNEKGSNNTNYEFSQLSLRVDCGEEYGSIQCELMGGHDIVKNYPIKAHGKKEDGTDDFNDKIDVEWEDRLDQSVMDTIGENCFIKVGIEKDENDKLIIKKFLSEFDAINYLKEVLKDGQTVHVKGEIKYSRYKDNTQRKLNVKAIYASNAEKDKFKATFIQTVLLPNGCLGEVDREKGTVKVKGYVVDYAKEWNNQVVKTNVLYPMLFEYPVPENADTYNTQVNYLFGVKTGKLTETTFEGKFVEGAVVKVAKLEELPADIQTLVTLQMMTLEEAVAKTVNGSKERRMILTVPFIKKITVDGNEQVTVDITKNKYDELDALTVKASDKATTKEVKQDVKFDQALNDLMASLG